MFLSLSMSFAGQKILFSDELFFNDLSEKISYDQIQEIIQLTHNWSWISYLILPIFSLLKFTIITSCISLGFYFAFDKWHFKPFFKVAILAEFVLLVPGLIKLLWFLFIQTDYTLNDLQLFYPLSLLNLFEPGTVEPYLLYPLQVLNLFEVAYWFALAYGVARVMNASLERGFGLVMASYGSGLVLWVVLVMFLTVSLS
ncbi:hypothetical protein J2I46_13120 [Fibrella sp. HMF5405]|uniref:Yip1 domain-containing protein n=1 Tax=Fibrella forsythiae TaxID=2817061 RepID=A0ABS3JHP2_9BACT|nr:hypothetical protein [Fibrella forsythiae]